MGKMKSYPSFDAYLRDQPRANQALIKPIRAFVKKAAPKLEEAVKWGNGCWVVGGAPVCYVYAAEGYTQFGFILGSKIKDPQGRLEGEGAYVRHVKLRKRSDIDPKYFAYLLKQAKPAWKPKARKLPQRAPSKRRAAPGLNPAR